MAMDETRENIHPRFIRCSDIVLLLLANTVHGGNDSAGDISTYSEE